MKKGDDATIFEDPLTELKPEGQARLMKLAQLDCGMCNGRRLERWDVRFTDGTQGERVILCPVTVRD